MITTDFRHGRYFIVLAALFIAPLLLAPVVATAHIRCTSSNATQAGWLLPIAGAVALAAAILQGQVLGLTRCTGFLVAEPDFKDLKPRQKQHVDSVLAPTLATCLTYSLVVAGFASYAYFGYAKDALVTQRLPFDLPDQIMWPFPPPSPTLPPLAPPPPQLPETTITFLMNPNVIDVLANFLWTAADLPMPPTMTTRSLILAGSVPLVFILVLCLALRAPYEMMRTCAANYNDEGYWSGDERTNDQSACGKLCLGLRLPFAKQYIPKLILFATIAAFDFTFDVSYVLTQPFYHRALWLVSVSLCFLPSLIFLVRSGMLKTWAHFAFKRLILYAFKGCVEGIKWLTESNANVVKSSCKMLGATLSAVKTGIAEKAFWFRTFVGRACMDGFFVFLFNLATAVSLLSAFVIVAVPLLLVLIVALVLITFSGIISSIVITIVAVAVVMPSVLILTVIVWPLIVFALCIIHINFKISLLPTPTRWLYKCMHAEEEYAADAQKHDTGARAEDSEYYRWKVHKHINLSFISELVGESIPQLLVVQANEYLVNYREGRSPTMIGYAQTIGSCIAIVSLMWSHAGWLWFYRGDFEMSLRVIILPLDAVDEKHHKNLMRDQARIWGHISGLKATKASWSKRQFREQWDPTLSPTKQVRKPADTDALEA